MKKRSQILNKLILIWALIISGTAFSQSPVEQVYPYLDAANSRWFFFSSASRPFGMVNLSPDTETGGAWGSGYRYHTTEIKGFSHIHAWQISGLSVMPVSGEYLDAHTLKEISTDHFSPFSHKNETAKPGFHQVFLERYNTNVELTSTTRVGFHKIEYPTAINNMILIRLQEKLGPSEISDGQIRQISETEIQGVIYNDKTIRRPHRLPVYFHISFNNPIENTQSFEGVSSNSINNSKGAFIKFKNLEGPLLMKVAISYVSEDQARKNMETELAHWNFEKIKTESFQEWNEQLSKIIVEDKDSVKVRRFYTDLWHALQGRRIISDADGTYADYTSGKKRIRQIPLNNSGYPKFNHHNSDSFWGAQWTINTLWPLSYPKITSDFVHSLLMYAKDGGMIPRGPSGGNYTFVMTGASSTPFIVSAWQKGIRDFDEQFAFKAMKKNHMPGGIMERSGYEHRNMKSGGISEYIQNGYVPYPFKKTSAAFHRQGPGQTLEYAYQDWTLAQMAKALNKPKDYNYFMNRSKNYVNVYDSVSGFMRPKDKKGNWRNPFDPGDYTKGFVEANSYQATWFVPHDYDGLADLMGGQEQAVERLDQQFRVAAQSGFTSGKKHADESEEKNRRIPINYGNQPSIQTAFIFSALNRPDLAQKWSRAVVDSVYSGLSPDYGYNGDEDQGLMGSLAVLMKIGLFQLNGGTEEDPIYYIGSPVFEKITLLLDDYYYPGKEFIIKTVNNSTENIFVKEITLNGKKLDRFYVHHSEIVSGGQLNLVMGR